jgi:hypothetical protein
MQYLSLPKNRSLLETSKIGCMLHYLLICLILVVFQLDGLAQAIFNVKDFGAKGDAVQFYVNTVSNLTVVTTTNQFSTADVGKYIEVFGVGKPTYGKNSYGVTTNDNQDLIALVTNVVAGTNLYLQVVQLSGSTTNYLPQVTGTAWATMGTDNTPIINEVIQQEAAGYSNVTIYIPNGTYLCLSKIQPSVKGYGCFAIPLYRGGLHILGQSQSGTVLLSRGAWQSWGDGAYPVRGFLFEVVAPVTNDFPLIIDNMTLDGGVQHGNLPVHGIRCNQVDGLGWDEQHSAYLTCDTRNTSGTATHQVLTNLTILHWRGEIIKSIDLNKNGNIDIQNCFMGDGCATALNIYPSWNVRNNTFSNLFQLFEFYQAYATNTGYFCNNFVTNITGNGLAFNGGYWGAPAFVMASNVFYFKGTASANGIQTLPGDNISIINNEIHCVPYMTAFVIGGAGSQGTQCNSNILISCNSVYCDGLLSTFATFGGPGVTAVYGLTICSNTLTATNVNYLLYGSSYSKDVQVFGNDFGSAPGVIQIYTNGGGVFPLIETNNNQFVLARHSNYNVATNIVSYGSGPIYSTAGGVATSNLFVLNDSESNQIPAGATWTLDNRTNSWVGWHSEPNAGDVYVQPSQADGTERMLVPYGSKLTFHWTGSSWTTNAVSSSSRPSPPTGLGILTQTNSSQ